MRKWMLVLAKDTMIRDIDMLESEDSSLGLIATIHSEDREVWTLRIENGQPILEKGKWFDA